MLKSLSARRAWIEMGRVNNAYPNSEVALRKESVDRNIHHNLNLPSKPVALRKESVDRNSAVKRWAYCSAVALRKESVDRNVSGENLINSIRLVALRKESVDRNHRLHY